MSSFEEIGKQAIVLAAKGAALRDAVQLMRDAQKEYFKNRTSENLATAKALEAKVDRLLLPEPEPSNQLSLL